MDAAHESRAVEDVARQAAIGVTAHRMDAACATHGL